ncbi:sulfite exporter TauE/SafE family protein [Victivallis vadensis]|uniref:sulfite exporter TauE/SafE family protein n=1 Tax=Victivallis vadensis TaxID=172901 RepID=UPI003D05C92B
MSLELWIVGPLIGFIGMMSGGYWGVGCGWIVVPTMLILGFSPFEAVGIGLLQMAPSTLPTVIRQFPEIGWGPGSAGRCLALPLGTGAMLTSLASKSINARLFDRFGAAPLSLMLCAVILAIAVQTLCSRTRCYDDELPPLTPRMGRIAFGTGLATGLLSSMLGVGGGILIRPLLTGGFKLPEYFTSRLVRLLVLLTTVTGGATYLVQSGKFDRTIFLASMLVAAGGMFGFPLGVKMHRIVYEAGYAQHIHKSFAFIAFALLLNTVFNLAGLTALSRVSMLLIGAGLTCYLAGFTLYARRVRR